MTRKLIAAAVVAALVWLVFFRRSAAPSAGTGTPPGQPLPAEPARERIFLRNVQTGQVMDANHPDAPPFIDTNLWKPYTPPVA